MYVVTQAWAWVSKDIQAHTIAAQPMQSQALKAAGCCYFAAVAVRAHDRSPGDLVHLVNRQVRGT
jgi:hypothetical protein